MPVIGILGGQSPETYEPFLVPFRQGLSEVGFVEGNNVAIESRWAQGRYDRLPDLADVLVSRRVTLIYAIGGTEVAFAAKGATQKIPSVFTIGGDPVKAGVVASLNRPGGNVTGTSFYTVGLGTKRLELLYELVPRASVIAVLMQTGSAIAEEQLSDLQQAANALRLRLVVLGVTGDADLEVAFAKVALEGAAALCVTAGAFFTSRRDKLVSLAAQHRIPTMYPRQEHVAAGGLMSYAPNVAQSYHRAGMYASYRCLAARRRRGRSRRARSSTSKCDASVYHLVGEREQPVGNLEAERLRGLEIDGQLEFVRQLDRQIGRFCPFENEAGVLPAR